MIAFLPHIWQLFGCLMMHALGRVQNKMETRKKKLHFWDVNLLKVLDGCKHAYISIGTNPYVCICFDAYLCIDSGKQRLC